MCACRIEHVNGGGHANGNGAHIHQEAVELVNGHGKTAAAMPSATSKTLRSYKSSMDEGAKSYSLAFQDLSSVGACIGNSSASFRLPLLVLINLCHFVTVSHLCMPCVAGRCVCPTLPPTKRRTNISRLCPSFLPFYRLCEFSKFIQRHPSGGRTPTAFDAQLKRLYLIPTIGN